VLSETGEGKVFEEWLGEGQFLAWPFCSSRRRGSALKTWLEHCILTTVGVRCQPAEKSKWKSRLSAYLEKVNVLRMILEI
jgi:hypothetical protein